MLKDPASLPFPPSIMPSLLFRRVLVASEDAAPREADVLIEMGVIQGVEPRGIPAPTGARVVEGGGRKLLLPGLL